MIRDDDPAPPPTRDLIERLRRRERDALEWLFDRHFDEIHGLVARVVGSEHVAEDLTQEIFVKVYESLPGFDPERPLSPWLNAIARNRIRDHWRSFARPDVHGASLDAEDALRLPERGAGGPLESLERTELEHELGRAIERLPNGMRKTVELRAILGLSFEDVGRRLNRTTVAVRKRYSRALELLRQDLAGAWLAG